MIDKTTIKLERILGYPRAKAQYDALLYQSWLTTRKAVDALTRKLKPLRASYGRVDAWVLSGKYIASLHLVGFAWCCDDMRSKRLHSTKSPTK
jgi:hypothetical protein